MLKSSLSDYSDAYMLVIETITVALQEGDNPNNVNKKAVFKNCVPFTCWLHKWKKEYTNR